MITYSELQKEKISAMKELNKLKKEVITQILARAKSIAIDKGADRENISDELILEAVLKEKKMCQEMINTCPSDRKDLLEDYIKKLEIINLYAPAALSEDEVRAAIKQILIDNSITNMGAAMKACNNKLKGQADGKLISSIVKEEFGK